MADISKKIVKFVSYDGILDPIGESQVLSYLKEISKKYSVKLLSFEKKNNFYDQSKVKIMENRLKEFDIVWKKLKYHNFLFFLGALLNILNSIIDNLFDIIFNNIRIFHIRSLIIGLSISPFLNLFKIKFIFDMRGFWADEKADRLGWDKKKIIYLFFKKLEIRLLKYSQYIVCLTNDAKVILINDYSIKAEKIFVIPTCVDTNKYKFKIINNRKKITFCHLGSYDTAYSIDKILLLFSSFLKIDKNIKLFIFTNQNLKKIQNKVYKYNIPNNNYLICSLKKETLIKKLSHVDIGVFYANQNFSIKGSYPTKIGEFLSCGIPVLCNNFNQDITSLINQNKVGFISDFDINNYVSIFNKIKKLINNNKIRINCRKVAENKLALTKGSKKFLEIYDKL